MNFLENSDNKPAENETWVQCLNRVPSKDHKYYLLLGCVDGLVSLYSKGVAWDLGDESRVARTVKSEETIDYYRSRNKVCLVIESVEELEIWAREWGCAALVEVNLWHEYDE